MRIEPPADIEANLRAQWHYTLSECDKARIAQGKDSLAYGTAMAVCLTFVTVVSHCYGCSNLKEAQAYLERL